MKSILALTPWLLCLRLSLPALSDDNPRIAQLDQFWSTVAQAVQSGNFAGYAATAHPKGVLVNGIRETSYPLETALSGWKAGFEATQSGAMKASVKFRFSKRMGDETTAHETGIFLYTTIDSPGKKPESYIHFEALLVREKQWRLLMEYQKSRAPAGEWAPLE